MAVFSFPFCTLSCIAEISGQVFFFFAGLGTWGGKRRCMVRGHPRVRFCGALGIPTRAPKAWMWSSLTGNVYQAHSALGERSACPGSWTIVDLEIMISLLGFRVTGSRFQI
jgi:hypothetical protein